jgi:hypothetical protein
VGAPLAHLWIWTTDGWAAWLLSGEPAVLLPGPDGRVQPSCAPATRSSDATLRCVAGEPARWALLAPPRSGVSVNGRPVPTGLRLLRDRDEIRLRGCDPIYFSSETLARIASFPGLGRPVYCPRCKDVIEAQSPAVRCPACSLWHHQRPDRACWTYAPTCACCDQPTPLDAGYRWLPEE